MKSRRLIALPPDGPSYRINQRCWKAYAALGQKRSASKKEVGNQSDLEKSTP